MADQTHAPMSRRSLFKMIGMAAGSAAMYQAMTDLGFAGESGYSGPVNLQGDPKGASVLILGAGLAGLTAALEMSRAGYKVQVLEYQHKAGGRNISIRGGDTVNELGGFTQHCQFDPGFYINPGPMRIPYHHIALLDYCKRLNVVLEPISIINYNAMIHNTKAFGGKAAYLWASTRALATCQRARVRCSAALGGARHERGIESFLIGVCNGRYFGSGMQLAPMALPDDGRFEVISIDAESKLAFPGAMNRLYTGRHVGTPGVAHFSCDAITMQLVDGRARRVFLLDVDGEPLGGLPLEVTLVPGALTMRAPLPPTSF